jgi:hypothetical protein
LERLDLSSNLISDDGCVALADGMKANSSLVFVRLWGNKGIGVGGFSALASMLEQNTTLERLETPLEGDSSVRVKMDECLNKNRENNHSAIAA